jgi:hypothetical protein
MHVIRLRGPWFLTPLKRWDLRPDGTYRPAEDRLPSARKMTMPADWSAAFGADFFGRVAYRRVFHRPTGLDQGERVFLVIDPARSEACITLKKTLVGFVYAGESSRRFDITDSLEADNELEIFVDHPAVQLIEGHPEWDALESEVGDPARLPPGGLVGEVRLEIEEGD